MTLGNTILEIDRLRKELDELRPLDPERMARVMQKFRLDWNYHSNHIEGNSLTYGETKSFLLHGITADGKPLKDHLDIKGHNEAILLLDEILKSERPVTETFMREIHKIILVEPYERPALTPDGKPTTRKIRVGEYKREPNHVRTVTGEIFYFATPEETPAKMEELMNWLRKTEAEGELHPLAIAALFHYKLIRIHPFDDGNGRISRIMMNLLLMKHGFPPVIVRSDKKEDYYRALRQADGGEEERFIDFIGERLVASLEIMIKGARGEDIEEEEDLDKRIQLMKGFLSGEKKIIFQSPETEIEFLRTSYSYLLDELFNFKKQFEDFFHTTSVINRFIYHEYEDMEDNLLGTIIETPQIFTRNPEKHILWEDPLETIYLYLDFNKFNRGRINDDFTKSYKITISFKDYYVWISWGNKKEKINYNDSMVNVVSSIIRYVKIDLLSAIERKIKK